MAEQNLFVDAVVLLGGAVVAAPIFKRIGLGTVLGYLAAGVVLGPVLQMFRDGEDIPHFAEIGVVFLLFVIGLELKPSRLWEMRTDIFGLGATQVVGTGIVLAGLALLLTDFSWQTATAIGFGLALSSTAFALQILEDRGETRTPYGKRAFTILLFQDLAIVPLLVAVPLLAAGTMEMGPSGWRAAGIAVAAIVALVLAGRYLLNPLFAVIAGTGAREAMIAAALFVVLGAAVLMQFAGLSMGMGAFVAGVMLSESSYRRELEADIEPFRGILLGLFFVAVGLSLDLGVVWSNILVILALVPALLAVKAAIIYVATRAFGSDHDEAVRVAAVLPQHGEFGFVLFSAAVAVGLLDPATSSLLVACVTFSMALTPLTVLLGERLTAHGGGAEEMEEDFSDTETDVLMIGFSRMGQIVAQVLLSGGLRVTVIDNNAERIRQAARFGFRIYFGDGTRKDVLLSADIEEARLVAVMTHDLDKTLEIVDLVRDQFPDTPIYVRSYDRTHSLDLRAREVAYELRETVESAFVMGAAILKGTGFAPDEAEAIVDDVRKRDEDRLRVQASDGLYAGRDRLHNVPQTPEPLLKPVREARAANDEGRAVLGDAAE